MTTADATILVADDCASLRQLLTIYLTSIGYHVLLAADGEELLHLARTERPALILSDLEMPVLDGVEAVRQLRADQRTARTPILIVSARADADALARAAGADGTLPKPCTLDELEQRLADLLDRR